MPLRLSLRAGLGAAAAGIALSACGAGTPAGASPAAAPSLCVSGTPTITAHGTGTAKGVPNLLTITVGVATQAPQATVALSQDNAKAAAVIADLKKGGVAAADLQTSGLSINPVYTGGATPTISSYQVTNSVTARVHDVAAAGTLIDSVAVAAGNSARIDQVAFSVDHPGGLAASARAAAVVQAESGARAMASAAGKHLGLLCSVADSAGSSQPSGSSGSFAATGAPAQSVPLQPGTTRVHATAKVVFALA